MAGAKAALGAAAQTIYKFDQADKILSLDADIFSGFNVRYIKDFSKGRAYTEEKKQINRLYAIETTVTLTGAKADHRLAVKPSQMIEIVKSIAAALGVSGATAATNLPANITQWISVMARDLQASRGRSLVVAGDNQPAFVHAAAHAINAALGNVGTTVVYTDPMMPFADQLQIDQLRGLVADVDAGRVKMLIVLGGNPVYTTPADLKLSGEKIKEKIPVCVHLGEYFDETAEYSTWHIPQNHFLESWSDTRAYDGTVSIVQPLIKPLYGGKSIHEVVQTMFRENYDKTDLDIVKEFWQKQGFAAAPKTIAATAATGSQPTASASPSLNASATPNASPTPAASPSPQNSSNTGAAAGTSGTAANGNSTTNFEDNWRKILHDGFVPGSGFPAKTLTANAAFFSQPINAPEGGGNLEISILPDPCVYDGRFTNNGWLQELPNPLTKITWENVALISPATARRLGLESGRRRLARLFGRRNGFGIYQYQRRQSIFRSGQNQCQRSGNSRKCSGLDRARSAR